MKDKKIFTTREICRVLDIPERQLIHWAEKGFVEPLVDADGFSSRREYSLHNVYQIAIIKTLWGRVSNKAIKQALMSLKAKKLLGTAFLIITGENVRATSLLGIETGLPIPTPLVRTVMKNDLTIILNLRKIRDQVWKALDEFINK